MSARFEELDWCPTPMGELTLRRRWDPAAGADVIEVKLGDDFLMSSLFTAAEEEMARLALSAVAGPGLDVLVGGLGLGYTAKTVLEHPGVRSLVVVEALDAVIGWHRKGLVPAGQTLISDSRCTLHHEDFFAMLRSPADVGPGPSGGRFHAVVVDIDHSPTHLLDPSHADLYEPEGLRRLADRLHPGGVFALWSNDPPEAPFTAVLEQVFDRVATEIVRFDNPLQDGDATNTVYVATTAPDGWLPE